jgi:hypothetical protein
LYDQSKKQAITGPTLQQMGPGIMGPTIDQAGLSPGGTMAPCAPGWYQGTDLAGGMTCLPVGEIS